MAAVLVLAAGIGSMAASPLPRGDDARGKRVFVAYCATCHGLDAKGGGPAARAMISGTGKHPRDLTNGKYLSHLTDEQLTEVIKWSGPKERHGSLLPMPQWAFRLNDQEVADVVAYIRVLSSPSTIKGDPVAGKKLFGQNCAACHGPGGKGNGPIGKAALGVMPRNFTDRKVMSQLSDRDIHNAIKLGGQGIGRSAWMPAWGGTLSEQEINDLVAYIRSLAPAH